MTDLRPLWPYAAPYRGALVLGMLLMLLESAAALAVPGFGGRLTGAFLGGGSVAAMLAAMLALYALQALLKFGNGYLLGVTAEKITADLKISVYDNLQALPLAYFQQRRQGDTLALLTRDVYTVGGYLCGTALSVAPLLFTVAGAAWFMFGIAPVLALLAALSVPLFYLMLKVLGRRLRPLAVQLGEEHATAVAIAEENLGLLPAIKTFTRESVESARHAAQIGRIRALSMRQLKMEAALGPAVQFVAAAGIVALLGIAGGGAGSGRMSPAALVSFLLYAQLLTRPVSGLAQIYGQTQHLRAALRRLLHALGESAEPAADAGTALGAVRGAIAFEHVGFAYPGRAAALRDLDLAVAAGETVAIVGPNGAGKSTLAHLLMRLHEPDSGRITIDGIDIRGVALASLRAQIGIVPQHVLLFNASVRDNIAYGRPEPTPQQVEAAARAARAHDFVVELPQGYNTPIGDRGVRLSGGQQQRIALARALLKDPPILILDEATAMFDPQGEAEFLEGCREAFAARTVLLITHRPASLAVAHRIVRMDGGRVVGARA